MTPLKQNELFQCILQRGNTWFFVTMLYGCLEQGTLFFPAFISWVTVWEPKSVNYCWRWVAVVSWCSADLKCFPSAQTSKWLWCWDALAVTGVILLHHAWLQCLSFLSQSKLGLLFPSSCYFFHIVALVKKNRALIWCCYLLKSWLIFFFMRLLQCLKTNAK